MVTQLIFSSSRSLFWLFPSLIIFLALRSEPLQAQVTPDNTLPNPSITEAGCTQCVINGGTVRGQNLFHSFSEFSIPTGGEAVFNNAPQIENILSRVTGNSISDIDGLIQANGSANFFLLNPNGIVFGPNAQLNIGGSFLASTADAIEFDDQRFYRASDPETSSLLSVNVPIGLQYGTQSPGTITNAGTLEVAPSQNLALVGGTITLNGGQLLALGGQIDLASLASAGTVEMTVDRNNWSLDLPEGVRRGNVSLLNDARVDVTADNKGDLIIQARNIRLNGERTRLLAGLAPPSNSPSNRAGDITLDATGDVLIEQGAAVLNEVLFNAQGTGGAIRITANSVSLLDGGQINTTLFGNGSTGQISIDAQEEVLISGVFFTSRGFPLPSGFSSTVQRGARGQTGDIEIVVRQGSLQILDGGTNGTTVLGEGQSGDVTLQTSDSIIVDGINASGFPSAIAGSVQAGATGQGGNLTIRTGTLTVSNGAEVFVTTGGIGDAGTIDIRASNAVILDGPDTPTLDPFSGGERVGGIFADVRPFVPIQENLPATGQGGDIRIDTPSLRITDGAIIEASTLGEGSAGDITIQAHDLLIQGRSALGASSGIFSAVQSEGEGLGGDITVTAESLRVIDAGKISTASFGQGDAGDIRLLIGSSLLLSDKDSGLFANVAENANGSGGSILIDAQETTMQNRARITVESVGNGRAGRTAINADRLTVRSGAAITSSTFSNFDAGDIELQVSDRLLLSGNNSGLFARTEPDSGGNGGSILVNVGQVQARNGATITTESLGSGRGGDIQLFANSLTLDNQAQVFAETASNTGGNIFLTLSDILLLLRGGRISTSAGLSETQGDGGNIIIEVNDGFIFAVSNENSDITANAFEGRGGNIRIAAQGIFGIEPRDELTELSDITASSEFGVDGVITLNTPDVDPSDNTIELPSSLVDASQLVAQGCTVSGNLAQTPQGEFVSLGRGGVAPSPIDVLTSDDILDDLQAPASWEMASTPETPIQPIEAQGWIRNSEGGVVLTAELPITGTISGCFQ